MDASTSPGEVRGHCRRGSFTGATSGLAAGFVQTNLVILPDTEAVEFRQFCMANPKPCPLIEVLAPGAVEPACARGADLRFDLPGYRVFRAGAAVEEVRSIDHLWRDDFVSFLIGCSFTFEAALIDAGIGLRHVEMGRNVAMYVTNRPCTPAGRFHGPLVVSMRPITLNRVADAIEISSRYPEVHGAPVQVGDPVSLGVLDLERPDFGETVPIADDEVPVFWACGVTPQEVVRASGVGLCITHAPGKMFVTDLRHERRPRRD